MNEQREMLKSGQSGHSSNRRRRLLLSSSFGIPCFLHPEIAEITKITIAFLSTYLEGVNGFFMEVHPTWPVTIHCWILRLTEQSLGGNGANISMIQGSFTIYPGDW